jgi:hypothetical protein
VLVIGLISKPLMVIVTMVNDMVGLRSSLELHGHNETNISDFSDFLLAILLCL